jgi:predicted nucleic acid-binding protein
MEAFFDASVLIAGTIGLPTGASSIVLSLVLLGGLNGVTVDNAIWETRAHLLAEFNEKRVKISFTETKRAIELITGAPTMTVHPWINPEPTLLPENPKDAYLLAAIDLHRPNVLLTLDEELWGAYLGVPIMSPKLFLDQQELDIQ